MRGATAVALWAGTDQLRAALFAREEPLGHRDQTRGRASAARPVRSRSLCTPPLHATSPRHLSTPLSTPQDLGEGIPPGVELLLDELGTRVAVAFADAADARQWLGLWCSACAAAVVALLVGSGLLVAGYHPL